jgi:hypothetical protein
MRSLRWDGLCSNQFIRVVLTLQLSITGHCAQNPLQRHSCCPAARRGVPRNCAFRLPRNRYTDDDYIGRTSRRLRQNRGAETVTSRPATPGTQKSHFSSREKVSVFSPQMLSAHFGRPSKPRGSRFFASGAKPLNGSHCETAWVMLAQPHARLRYEPEWSTPEPPMEIGCNCPPQPLKSTLQLASSGTLSASCTAKAAVLGVIGVSAS